MVLDDWLLPPLKGGPQKLVERREEPGRSCKDTKYCSFVEAGLSVAAVGPLCFSSHCHLIKVKFMPSLQVHAGNSNPEQFASC